MRLSRIIMALTVGLAVVAVPTAAGAAAPQPPAPGVTTDPPQPPPGYTPVTLTVDKPEIYLGDTVELTGRGFGGARGGESREWVDFTVTTTPIAAPAANQAPARRSDGSTIAMAPVAFAPNTPSDIFTNDRGELTRKFKPSVTGLLTITATGRETGRSASTQLRVLDHRQPPPLPVTGDSLGTPMKVGGGLVGAGAVLLLLTFAWRRRQRFMGSH